MHVRRTVYSMLQISLILSQQNYRTSEGSSKGLPLPSACFSDETITRSQGHIMVSVKFGTYHPQYRVERVVNMVMWYVFGKLPTPYGYRFIWRVGSRYWREGLVRYYRRSCIVTWIQPTSNVHVMWTQEEPWTYWRTWEGLWSDRNVSTMVPILGCFFNRIMCEL